MSEYKGHNVCQSKRDLMYMARYKRGLMYVREKGT